TVHSVPGCSNFMQPRPPPRPNSCCSSRLRPALCRPMTTKTILEMIPRTPQPPAFALGLTAACLLALGSAPARAQMGDPSKVTLKTTPVTASISMIEGVNGFAGGNVGVSIGDDGVFIIDEELQPMTPKLKSALAALSKKPVRFLVNTHWHSDHTGGNPALAAAGAVIVAQEN